MTAILGTVPARILLVVADAAPVELSSFDMPVELGGSRASFAATAQVLRQTADGIEAMGAPGVRASSE